MYKLRQFLPVIILVGIAFAIYAFNLNNSLFWDDDDWIKGNVFVHDFFHLKEIFTQNVLSGFGLNSNYYRPLLLISFAVNYAIGGIKPLSYHLVNNGFHIANGILVFSILYYALRRKSVAFLAALIFLIHPLQTEAVTYISGRGDPMSVFFMLLALWLFMKSKTGILGSSIPKRYSIFYLLLSIFSFILAILSRESAIILPALLVVFYVSFLSHDSFIKSLGAAFLKTWHLWSVSAGYFVLRLTVLNFQNTLNFYAQANDYTQHLSYRLYTFAHALVEYFKLIFVPIGLHMERDLPIKTSLFQWPVWLGAIMVAGILYLVFRFYRKDKIQNTRYEMQDTNFRIWFFSWGWFFVGLVPVSGIIPINAVMYEHWLYLPLIGFFTLVAFYLVKLFHFLKLKKNPIFYFLFSIFLVAYFSFFGYQSIQRNILWGKPIEFYEDILKYNPNTVRIMNNLGNLYSERGDEDKAEELYTKAIQSPNGKIFAQPYYNLGNIYRDRGETERAIAKYKEAIEADPSFPFAYQNLAVIYAGRGNLVEAAMMLEKVKKLKPRDPRVYYNLGLVYLAQNKKSLAIENLQKALKYSANDPEVASEIRRILELEQ